MANTPNDSVSRRGLVTIGGASLVAPLVATAASAQTPLAQTSDPVEAMSFTESGRPDHVQPLLARLRQMDALVTGYGAVGDGISDDTPAIRAAIAANAGGRIYFPAPAAFYRCGSPIGRLPYGTRLRGASRGSALIKRAFDSRGEPLLILSDSSALEHLAFDGDGRRYDGDLLHVLGDEGNQILRDVRIVNSRGPCLYFQKNAGSRFTGDNIEASRTDADQMAIVIEDADAGGTPRSFNRLETGGHGSIATGGANNLYISNSSLFAMTFSVNSHDVTIMNSRMGSVTAYLLKGSGAIIGGAVAPDLTIDRGAVWTVVPAYTNRSIFDHSGGTAVVVQHKIQAYDPVLKAIGKPVALARDARLTGRYSRSGKLVTCKIRFLPGSRPLPPGPLSLTLPIPTSADLLQCDVSGRLQTSDGVPYRIAGYIREEGDEVILERDTDGPVTATSPGPMGPGAGLWLQFSYET